MSTEQQFMVTALDLQGLRSQIESDFWLGLAMFLFAMGLMVLLAWYYERKIKALEDRQTRLEAKRYSIACLIEEPALTKTRVMASSDVGEELKLRS